MSARDAPPPDRQQADSDRRFTDERSETKYFVASDRRDALIEALDRWLPRHEFRGALSQLSGPESALRSVLARQGGLVQHYISTLYFDTPEGELYHENLAGLRGRKVRVREYYDLHPALTELATTPDEAVSATRTRWLELKHRESDRTFKTRLGVSRTALGQLVDAGAFNADAIELRLQQLANATPSSGPANPDEFAVLHELQALLSRLGGPLRATALVHYRRRAWQSAELGLRVTLDSQLQAVQPTSDVASDDRAWTRERLGQALAEISTPILEIKQLARGSLAPLEQLIRPFDLEPATLPPPQTTRRMSKFLWACGATRG